MIGKSLQGVFAMHDDAVLHSDVLHHEIQGTEQKEDSVEHAEGKQAVHI
jgi:hypothetical protein